MKKGLPFQELGAGAKNKLGQEGREESGKVVPGARSLLR